MVINSLNISKSINQFSKDLSLNFKSVLKDYIILIQIFFVNFFLILFACDVIPFYTASPFIFQTSIVFSGGIVFAKINYGWNKSTLYQNRLTINNKISHTLSSFFTVFIVSILSSTLILIMAFIFEKLNLLMSVFYFHTHGIEWSNNFSLISYSELYYSLTLVIIISFLMSYIFSLFCSNRQGFFVFTFIIVLLSFFIGGMFNTYFPTLNSTYNDSIGIIPRFQPKLYPAWFFPISLIFPLFAPGQTIGFIIYPIHFSASSPWEHFWVSFLKQPRHAIQWVPISAMDKPYLITDAINWDLILIVPGIWMGLLFIIIGLLKTQKRNIFKTISSSVENTNSLR